MHIIHPMKFYHFNIFSKMLTPMAIIEELLQLGDKFLIKVQMISTILTLQS